MLPAGRELITLHGGGLTIGDRFIGADAYPSWAMEFDAVVVAVEYRPAPENPDPAPVDDCYAGLVWMTDHAEELGFNADRLVTARTRAAGSRQEE